MKRAVMTDEQSRKLAIWQAYLNERKMLIESEWAAAAQFDKTMVTLASGALGLTLVFIEKIAPNPTRTEFLAVAWICLILALFTVLISHLTSEASMRRQRKILDHEYDSEFSERSREQNIPNVITAWLNRLSIALFISGITFLVIFAFVNLPG